MELCRWGTSPRKPRHLQSEEAQMSGTGETKAGGVAAKAQSMADAQERR